MTNQMLAYHANPVIKAKYLMRVRAHAAADEIIHGRYWENGKGCAVGCTLHSSDHIAYETELGIPVALARLEDCLFEGQRNGDALTFPVRFLESAKVGADLSRVSWQFLHWLLTEELAGRDHPLVRDAIKRCADVLAPLTKGESVDKSAATSAAWSAVSAVSAVSAAWSAESAAWSAVSAAWSAAWRAARSAAWSAAYKRMADKLLVLIEAAPLIKPYIIMGAAV